jgi:hypothetical protein
VHYLLLLPVAWPRIARPALPDLRESSGEAGNDEAALVCENNRLHTVAQIELQEDAGDVGLDRALFDDETCRDLAIRQPLGYQAQDVALPRGQRIEL